MKRHLLVLVTLLAASLPVTEGAQETDPLEGQSSLPNYYRLRPDIATAGQPTDEALEAVQRAGFKAVLNLRTEQEGSLDEKPKVEALGMEYFNIPIGREGFSPEIVSKFRDILAESANRPILIHCASSNRVGAMWYIHQVLENGESESSALEEAKKSRLALRNPRRTRQRLRRPEQGQIVLGPHLPARA